MGQREPVVRLGAARYDGKVGLERLDRLLVPARCERGTPEQQMRERVAAILGQDLTGKAGRLPCVPFGQRPVAGEEPLLERHHPLRVGQLCAR